MFFSHRLYLSFFLFLFSSANAIQVTIVAPADARKDGGLKFKANIKIGTSLEALKSEFRNLHSARYGAPGYGIFELLSDKTGKTIKESDLSLLEEGETLRLFRPRGTKSGSVGGSVGVAKNTEDENSPAPEYNSDDLSNIPLANTGLNYGNGGIGGVGGAGGFEREPELPSDPESPFYVSDLLFALEKTKKVEKKEKILKLLLKDESKMEQTHIRQILTAADCSNGIFRDFIKRHYEEGKELPGVQKIARECDEDGGLKEMLVRSWFGSQGLGEDEFLGNFTIAGVGSQGEKGGKNGNMPGESWLGGGYIGQQEALARIKPLVMEQILKRRISDAPLSLLFLGPSGVGKTELARKLAEQIHCGKSGGPNEIAVATSSGSHGGSTPICNIKHLTATGKFVEFKMGNYRSEEQFTNWIGVPDGVKGSDGHLSDTLFKNPDAVIYLDEIEKSISAAGDLLLSMLDNKGSVQVSKTGQHVSTVKATFILSSNLGTDAILDLWSRAGFQRLASASDAGQTPEVLQLYKETYDKIVDGVQYPLQQSSMFQRPELRNRLAGIIPFTPFLPHEVRELIELELVKLKASYHKSEGWGRPRLAWNKRVIEYFLDSSQNEFIAAALERGNLRELIRFVEQSVNQALNLAKDCPGGAGENCGALSPEPFVSSTTISSSSGMASGYGNDDDSPAEVETTTSVSLVCRPRASELFHGQADHFVLDVKDGILFAESVPTTLNEAFLFCGLPVPKSLGSSGGIRKEIWGLVFGHDESKDRESMVRVHEYQVSGGGRGGRGTTASSRSGAEAGAGATGGHASGSSSKASQQSSRFSYDYESSFDYSYVLEYILKYEKVFAFLFSFVAFYAFGIFWAAAAFAGLKFALFPVVGMATRLWGSLPAPIRNMIKTGVSAGVQGVVVGAELAYIHWDWTLVALVLVEAKFSPFQKILTWLYRKSRTSNTGLGHFLLSCERRFFSGSADDSLEAELDRIDDQVRKGRRPYSGESFIPQPSSGGGGAVILSREDQSLMRELLRQFRGLIHEEFPLALRTRQRQQGQQQQQSSPRTPIGDVRIRSGRKEYSPDAEETAAGRDAEDIDTDEEAVGGGSGPGLAPGGLRARRSGNGSGNGGVNGVNGNSAVGNGNGMNGLMNGKGGGKGVGPINTNIQKKTSFSADSPQGAGRGIQSQSLMTSSPGGSPSHHSQSPSGSLRERRSGGGSRSERYNNSETFGPGAAGGEHSSSTGSGGVGEDGDHNHNLEARLEEKLRRHRENPRDTVESRDLGSSSLGSFERTRSRERGRG